MIALGKGLHALMLAQGSVPCSVDLQSQCPNPGCLVRKALAEWNTCAWA